MDSLLLERDGELASLHALLSDTITGHGRIALIKGEAGIGKTTLVERFLAQTQERRHDSVRSLWAGCEALFTPRPLGPLYDIAQQTAAPLRALLDGEAKRATIFAAALDLLVQSPFILVIEDIHWADEATLDFIKYLARRIQRTATLLILTYRDDEIHLDHPLRRVLGDLPVRDVTGIQLRPLSEEAVAMLELRAHRPIGRLRPITGGNTFFVVEALADDTLDAPGTPATISDAVLARIAHRSPAARRLLESVAVAPNKIERWVIKAVGADDEAALDECLAAQMLRLDGQTIGFRHELARRAVEEALSSAGRQTLHAKILHALLEQGGGETPLARLAHHAAVAEDATLVLRFAPCAAQQAAAQGAHREAIAHYQAALHYANRMTSEQQAEALNGLSNEYYLTGQIEEAEAPCKAALALWRGLDQRHKVGRTLRRLSRLSWGLGRNAEAERYGLEAVEELEALPPDRELAMAFANMAHLSTRTIDTAATLLWGGRAIALAEHLGDNETVCYALNSVGAAEIDSGDERGQTTLERSLGIALEHGYEEHVARAYGNLAICKVGFRHYDEAERYLREGIDYCAERDLDFWGHFLRWVQARARLERGDWIDAENDATALLSVPWMAVTNRLPALLILGRIRARRGDVAAEALLHEARDLALTIGEPRRMEQVASARAEWRWLQDDLAGCAAEAGVAIRSPYRITHPWYQSDVVIWLWRSGSLSEAPSGVLEPYVLEISGDWHAAADAWGRFGCPWEQALALMQGDEAAQRAALDTFERLGATPAAVIAKQRLRERGARGLPRGPYASTRANQQGLTNRQVEVLQLLAEGLRDVEIADRLSISRRTAEQHVAGVLMKFNARTRAEAVRRAHAFSRIIVCASCRRQLRVTSSKGVAYYRDTSLVRGLSCAAYGCLSVKGAVVLEQFGAVLASVTLPEQWREAVATRLQMASTDTAQGRTRARRAELEAEQKRLALAFTKGVIDEETLDEQVARIRAELVTLPLPQARDTASAMQAALDAGETLADMASYWGEATAEERRDMVWALLALEGLVYDLERQGIVGLVPRPDTLPVLALGLGTQWEQRPDGGLWLRDGAIGGQLRPSGLQDRPPFRPGKLTPQQRDDALAQLRAGQSPQQVADALGVSYWVILRLIKRHDPAKLPAQQQPKLTPEQQAEARRMLAEGMTLRQVGRHFGVSYGAIWRLTHRDEVNDTHETRNEGR